MNRSFDNIESRKFPGQSHRVGYAPISGVWHIKGTTGRYFAYCQTSRAAGSGCFAADTLAEVSSILRTY